ncbi:MAG: c-type cytochrome [Gammaproteobacteria bacterium]|nr:c-type cytochrome [Gammaproteobacteria bacterium]
MMVSRIQWVMSIFLIAIIWAIPVCAQEASKDRILYEIDQRLSNKFALKDAIDAGRERAVLCQSCHGEDGNSVQPEAPNLAGQNAGYLLDQISRFADGRRKDFVMNQLAENFTADDKINIAIFYYSMPVKPQHVNWHLVYIGEPLYKDRCSSCHGEEGMGHTNLARLAGQQVAYVKKVLTQFRKTANHLDSKSETPRKSATMEKVVKNLTDEQIDALAEYVAQLGFEDNE